MPKKYTGATKNENFEAFTNLKLQCSARWFKIMVFLNLTKYLGKSTFSNREQILLRATLGKTWSEGNAVTPIVH